MMNPQVCFVKNVIAAPAIVLGEKRIWIEILLHLNSFFNEQFLPAHAWNKEKAGTRTLSRLE